MNNAPICHAVNYRYRSVVGFNGLSVIAAFDGCVYLFDLSAYHGSERRIMAAANFTLSCALAGL